MTNLPISNFRRAKTNPVNEKQYEVS